MANYRIYVEKREAFRVEAESLRQELNENLQLHLSQLRYINIYDLFGFTPELLEQSRYSVFGEVVTDIVSDTCDLAGKRCLAVEYIPGQFDQRASSAVDCVHLIDPNVDIEIRSARLLIFDDTVNDADLARIRHYYINAVESREKDLSQLEQIQHTDVKPLAQLDGFLNLKEEDLAPFCKQWGLAMNADDLREVLHYFTKEQRNPTETELRILDTYWSDHCRHTTFTTVLETIKIDESFVHDEIESTLGMFHDIRTELGRTHKPLCLMELATIGARYLRSKGLLDDMEQSEENNACSVFIDVDVDGKTEKWLLQFKNETHNHPTEIEPFGGASTCLGGAIRDPLSGRAYVYQAMRVTGAGDIYKPVSETMAGKLPQQIISRKAAAGYSSYGNQIGLATTHVREIYHPAYVAKRLEVGAVVGAVRADAVRRESPAAGDVILLLGGRTGRDGIGGATGSSKEHTEASLESCGSEVQKGNAPEERKLQRLMRRPEATRLIKKSNDFGAGGVSVAIGELADGLDIYLDRVPTKYVGLNPTELAISESQERMAVVVEAKDREEMERLCQRDNIEVTYVADVTATGRMRQFYKGEIVADLTREFIDSAGAKHYADATIGAVEQRNPFRREIAGKTLTARMENALADPNVTSQKGLIEEFDATIGRSTVLMPFGGRLQQTETQVSVQKLPTDGYTNTASIMAFGYNPFISEWSPYHGAAYAIGFGGVAEAVAKMSFGNALGVEIQIDENELFDYQYGSILVEATCPLDMENAILLGHVVEGNMLTINGEAMSREHLHEACCAPYTRVYPAAVPAKHQALLPAGVEAQAPKKAPLVYAGEAVEHPTVYIPVFPGTNCDYDSAKAWRNAGAVVETTVFRNLTGADVLASIDEMVEHINRAHILMFVGGFSAGDEPDGSGKFIASVINNIKVSAAIESLIARGGLILGICNGFQALVKSGLLPYGKTGSVTTQSPTLFRNDINRHVSQMVTTVVASTNSPWLSNMQQGDAHTIAVSHGEGKFVVSEALAAELFRNGQVAFRYADPVTLQPTMQSPANPNGSYYAIEGIISPNGQILGKMAHSERYEDNVFKNISGQKRQTLFDNAVRYFRKK